MIKTEKISLPVEGMTCASCVARVEKTVKKFEGVSNVNVNLATEKITLDFDPAVVDLNRLAETVEDIGYKLDLSVLQKNKTSKQETKEYVDSHLKKLKSELIFAIVLTIPIAIINMGMMWEGFYLNNFLNVEQINKILLLLTTPVIFVSGKRFYKIFWNNLKHFTADMNSLVAIGTGAAYLFSLIITLFPEIFSHANHNYHVYYDTTAVIITLILLGRWLESRAKSKTGTAIKKLIELQPKTAIVKENNKEIEKNLDELKLGDIIIIKPGGKIPADGFITSGSSAVNEAMITGESLPVEKIIGSKVIGGTINISGYFEFEITTIGKNSVLGQIIKLVEEAQGSKAPIQNLADKVAAIFVPVVVIIAILTFIVWMFINPDDISVALMNFVAVLIIACPCALGLATPTALIVGMGKAAQNGILFKNGEALEELHRADTIIFDKTGTITEGKLSVQNIFVNNIDENEFLILLSSLESKSEHPIAKAIVEFANKKNIKSKSLNDFENKPGKGIKGTIENKAALAGNESFMIENKIDLSVFNNELKNDAIKNSSLVFLALDGKIKGFLNVIDSVKQDSYEVIKNIKEMNIEPFLLSGDNENVTKFIASETGIEKYAAGVLPENKSNKVKSLQEAGSKVIMVGDGINDAPALVQSNVGIAIGNGTDVAIESADVVLLKDDLHGVVKSIKLSKQTIAVIKQNLFWAFIYNVIGIPLAFLGILNPMFAALAMSLSSVSVISNSLRLKKAKI
ncbi:MAG TPA: heavy metal translocating P-type ATPase [Ignavibacteriaceae bacterium]|nr:heavy metal translocating P-type ATPase [Ignavibacteriaceae bacterium]